MKTLRFNATGPEVAEVQKMLGLVDDGIYGPKTEFAVKKFQSMMGLQVDGICGRMTWQFLKSKCRRMEGVEYVPISKHLSLKNRSIDYIVIHYTAGKSSAKGNAMKTRNGWLGAVSASADFAVDDETIVQANPNLSKYYCWAVGKSKMEGVSNKNCVSIEICSTLAYGHTHLYPNTGGWYFTEEVMKRALSLAAWLMKEYDIPLSHVIRHYDVSGKHCPGVLGWNDARRYNEDGNPLCSYNTSEKWYEFKEKLKTLTV